jgi:methionyl-tRNA formyltransferase
MRIVYFGWDQFAVPTLMKLSNSDHEVVAVVTRPNEVTLNGLLFQAPVAIQAEKHGFPILGHENLNTPEFIEQAENLKADLGIVAASGPELSEPLRNAFGGGCIGIHLSLLPKYRGPSPIAWAILKGEKKTGVTVLRITDQPYAGPVLVQRETMIPSDEIWFELHYRLARVACDAIDAALKTLDQDAYFAGEPQDESQATWAPELAATDGYLCFDESAEAIALRCRATWPWPGALSRYVNKKGETENLKIVRARAGAASIQVPPGTITSGFKIATADGELEIQHLELSDRRVIPWQDFVKQRQVSPGDRFEPVAR